LKLVAVHGESPLYFVDAAGTSLAVGFAPLVDGALAIGFALAVAVEWFAG
jgi:hypothetical protein